ncbi:hypothetical protein I5843_09520 [Streptococcus pneumoniae]|uniref:hypothetical protein n=1 Tax=Streptococcus pneumoniae TaxID=1313 RepID=UPI0009DA6C03|nr:hypothetical protein [Streptococcus pneumoniae]MBW5020732.1 hypothetical protein [Streptococcus pneumoniae]MBW5135925.1 hypothetical protein [Streptococcus pneumoniae]MBW5243249.1 hypothetical protein [Streptococcus pneumoniae]MDG7233317.1 hypothetical protein [Streptococcus pneumoniae]MDG7358219.1 hypothetical protein [Streptococcus pneumoniae]
MFILKHGTREDKPFLMSAVIGVTGLDISCSEEKKAMRFVSRGAAVQVLPWGRLRKSAKKQELLNGASISEFAIEDICTFFGIEIQERK